MKDDSQKPHQTTTEEVVNEQPGAHASRTKNPGNGASTDPQENLLQPPGTLNIEPETGHRPHSNYLMNSLPKITPTI
ncbi:hypothetical protein AVEN_16932-1 [Araneus ventricosus]|uniref:Uncharacterized protein n=1 Tax=Araneus ventricosus TaxID=182803 RepID=A0A4Y2PQQ7_ARAVE|nr:hypothetical protein AVEN_16932-1 [Araneus ventricosus]